MDTLYRPFLVAMDARSASASSSSSAAATGKKRKAEPEGADDGFEGIVSGCVGAAAGGPAQLKHAVLKSLFTHAARPDARDANRRKVYLVWNEFGGADGEDEGEGEGDEW
jgi:hypothetical protein